MLPYIDTLFEYPATLTGASIDELKLISSFLLSYPLSALLKRIPDRQPWNKNTFIIGVSLFYLVGLFDLWGGLQTLLFSAAGTYAIAYYLDGSLMPWVGFVFLMGCMSVSHIYRQILDDAQAIDVTGAQMVLVMKLCSFCWNVHDGRLPQEQLSDAQKYTAIREIPGILDYLAYALFFPSLFAGPTFEYVYYHRWIDTTLFDVPPGTDPSKAPRTRKKRKIPRSGRPATKKLLIGLAWILAFLQLSSLYPVEAALDQDLMNYSFFRRVLVLHMLGFTTRLKYYGVWSLTEGACILSGMGYNGFDQKTGKVFWNRLENVDPIGLETAQNTHGYLGSWNKNTNSWLRNCVYLRVTPKGKKPGFRATLATFLTSAFWHGFYPGYSLTFLFASFVQMAAKNFRRYVRPFFLTPDGVKPTPFKRYYDIVSWIATQLTLTFAVLPFIILSFNNSIKVWSRVYFYGIVCTFASLAIFASPVKTFLIKQIKLRNSHTSANSVQEPIQPPTLGLPYDPEREFDEAVQEIKAEIEASRRRGSAVNVPSGTQWKTAVEERLGRKLS